MAPDDPRRHPFHPWWVWLWTTEPELRMQATAGARAYVNESMARSPLVGLARAALEVYGATQQKFDALSERERGALLKLDAHSAYGKLRGGRLEPAESGVQQGLRFYDVQSAYPAGATKGET